MSSDWVALLGSALELFTFAVFVLSSLRAYQARRVLASPAHRNRALWTSVLGISMIPFELSVFVYLGVKVITTEVAVAIAFVIAFNLVAFLYLDSTIQVARTMDFFHRDTYRWGKTKLIVLGLFVVGIFGTLFSPVGAGLFQLLWVGTFACCAFVLIVTSLRVRDRAMRTYTKWIGLFAVMVALPFIYEGSSNIPLQVGYAIASLVYYKATVSLLITGQVTGTTA